MITSIKLRSRVRQYLRERRHLGFQLRNMGLCLNSFTNYIVQRQHTENLTADLMADWARHNCGGMNDRYSWARRLMILRPFMRWLQQFEPSTEVPDEAIFGRIKGRSTPHIYQEQELVDLLNAARQLTPLLRGATYEALFGLISATGMRLSEAVHLSNADVDLKDGILTIRRTKFAKSRQVPIHPSTVNALKQYRRIRDQWVTNVGENPFFVGTRGLRLGQELSTRQVDRVFMALRVQLAWQNRGAHVTPRVHDLRHTFVVRRILAWQEEDKDIDQAMLGLSTYVGHAKITHTYWYLTAVPELMALAAARFESHLLPEVHHA